MSIKKYVFGKNNGSALFLDKQPYTAFYAYSLRRLSANYTGKCIRVRRSSDNEEMDVDFSENKINTVALISFIGAYDGFVSVWYDQSGNGKNQNQTIVLNQPKIVTSGAILLENDLPTISFTVTNSMNLIDTREIDECCIFYVVSIKTGTQDYYGVARHIPITGYGFALYASNGTQNPSIIPFNNGLGYSNSLHLQGAVDIVPTSLTVRSYSLIGSSDILNTLCSKNSSVGKALLNEANWGHYSTSGINMGYNGATANMNISEYIVFEKSNRSSLSKLIENSISYYNI